MAPVRASEAGTPATRSSTRRAPSTAPRAGSVAPTPAATPSAGGGKTLVKPQPTKAKIERPGWGVGAKKTETAKKADGSSSSLLTRPVPTTTASSSTLASAVATPKHSSMASKFLNAANSVRKIAQPAFSRLQHVTGASGAQAGDKESIKAYLRIRPTPPGSLAATTEPYLVMSHDTEVIMTAPSDPTRPNSFLKPSQAYTFTKIFAPETPQPEFFKATALPLVQSLLNGENGLVFAYGVTNSGKSYTIQGGADADGSGEERGVIPRAIDVVFNSVEDRQTEANIRPTFLSSVEIVDEANEGYTGRPSFLSRVGRSSKGTSTPTGEERDQTVLPVDKNYSYAVFVSYCEVYNEKIYDLLDNSATGPASSSTYTSSQPSSGIPRAVNQPARASLHPEHSSSAFGSSHTLSGLGRGEVKRKALTLKNDVDASGKYVAGLKEIRVWSREEAQAVVAMGQINRQVFGTLANSVSSRSHGVFTIKIVRVHNGAPDDVQSMQSSRLSIVDLAGSERTKNTGNTGERLKEAGNINKSLMVLGQCMEVLHSNQKRAGFGRKPAMVPFRHSKLTEMFQNYFIGDGRAVMMIHVNPFDTGFDENSHVMRFSAVARDVFTTTHMPAKFVRRPELPPSQLSEALCATTASACTARPAIPRDMLKAGTTSIPSAQAVVVHAPEGEDVTGGDAALVGAVPGAVSPRESEVERVEVEEELMPSVEEEEEEEEDDEPDALVEHLFDVVKELRMKVFELELRCGTIETETREELSRQFDKRERDLERQHMERLIAANERSEVLKAKQIDIVQRSVRKPQPARTTRFATPESARTDSDEDGEEEDEDEEDDDEEVDKSLIAGSVDTSFDTDASASEPPSPTPGAVIDIEPLGEPVKSVSKALQNLAVQSSDADETDGGDATETTVLYVDGELPSTDEEEDEEDQDDDDESFEEFEGGEDEDADASFDASVVASSAESTPIRTSARPRSSAATRKSTTVSSTAKAADKPALKAGRTVSRAVVADENMPEADDQAVDAEDDEDPMMLEAAPSSTAGSSKKAALRESVSQAEAREMIGSPGSEVTSPIVKKKKRKLGGAKRVLTEEEILHFQDQSLRGGAVPRLVKGGF